jgi:hypothetical protein
MVDSKGFFLVPTPLDGLRSGPFGKVNSYQSHTQAMKSACVVLVGCFALQHSDSIPRFQQLLSPIQRLLRKQLLSKSIGLQSD